MEANEILRKAWEAVEKAGVPEPLQEVAFKEAVNILRDADAGSSASETSSRGTGPAAKPKTRAKARERSQTAAVVEEIPDEETFFARLAEESGLPETDLRDILQLASDGKVHVTPPTRLLGDSVAQQARTVIALVASARSKGLGEKPVSADAVRKECDRKHCFQQNNFAHLHLGVMKGFNSGSTRNEIHVTSKWLEDFVAAVNQAHGRTAEQGES
jgi:hypothetical protein